MTFPTNKTVAEMTTLVTVSPLVIARRMTEFWLTATDPTDTSKREAADMLTEKIDAMGESAVAMNLALARVARDTATSTMNGIVRDGQNDADDIMSAALRPYTSRVKANDSRLRPIG